MSGKNSTVIISRLKIIGKAEKNRLGSQEIVREIRKKSFGLVGNQEIVMEIRKNRLDR